MSDMASTRRSTSAASTPDRLSASWPADSARSVRPVPASARWNVRYPHVSIFVTSSVYSPAACATSTGSPRTCPMASTPKEPSRAVASVPIDPIPYSAHPDSARPRPVHRHPVLRRPVRAVVPDADRPARDIPHDLLDDGSLRPVQRFELIRILGRVPAVPVVVPQPRKLLRTTCVIALAVRAQALGHQLHHQRPAVLADPGQQRGPRRPDHVDVHVGNAYVIDAEGSGAAGDRTGQLQLGRRRLGDAVVLHD